MSSKELSTAPQPTPRGLSASDRVEPTVATERPEISEGFLTTREIASRLRIHEATVRRWCSDGLVDHLRLGHVIRLRWEDVVSAVAVRRASHGNPDSVRARSGS